MTTNKLLIIGADSDLIQPLVGSASAFDIDILPLRRVDWDLTDPNPPADVLDRIAHFSPNHLLYSAGLNSPQNIKQDVDLTLGAMADHLSVNCLSFLSVVLHVQALSDNPLLSIHALSSLYGIYGRKTRLPYCVSKHALEGAVKCLATELPSTLVLAYRPGFFKTKLTDKNLTPEMQAKLVKRIPASRFGQPSDLSSLIVQNIIKPPLYASGTAITMDGGLTAGGIFEL